MNKNTNLLNMDSYRQFLTQYKSVLDRFGTVSPDFVSNIRNKADLVKFLDTQIRSPKSEVIKIYNEAVRKYKSGERFDRSRIKDPNPAESTDASIQSEATEFFKAVKTKAMKEANYKKSKVKEQTPQKGAFAGGGNSIDGKPKVKKVNDPSNKPSQTGAPKSAGSQHAFR